MDELAASKHRKERILMFELIATLEVVFSPLSHIMAGFLEGHLWLTAVSLSLCIKCIACLARFPIHVDGHIFDCIQYH